LTSGDEGEHDFFAVPHNIEATIVDAGAPAAVAEGGLPAEPAAEVRGKGAVHKTEGVSGTYLFLTNSACWTHASVAIFKRSRMSPEHSIARSWHR
jgi:hypothetical protein